MAKDTSETRRIVSQETVCGGYLFAMRRKKIILITHIMMKRSEVKVHGLMIAMDMLMTSKT
ncbi:MAG: hypothetical protein PHW64_03260 [Sulfuricurvum sp.]|nr:hypothetical protein [Sulfuricurvum sp.]